MLPTDLLTSATYPFILEWFVFFLFLSSRTDLEIRSVDAAQQVIEIVIDDLQKLLGLKQAPAKVWLRLVYAATVLLKATCTPNANLVSVTKPLRCVIRANGWERAGARKCVSIPSIESARPWTSVLQTTNTSPVDVSPCFFHFSYPT